jgi:hypothetical protein
MQERRSPGIYEQLEAAGQLLLLLLLLLLLQTAAAFVQILQACQMAPYLEI